MTIRAEQSPYRRFFHNPWSIGDSLGIPEKNNIGIKNLIKKFIGGETLGKATKRHKISL
jgi:hypothetical protein